MLPPIEMLTPGLPITILEKKKDNLVNSIIYEIPPGKPNPRPLGEEKRSRVLQKAAVGDHFYYALNLIRERRNKPYSLLEQQQINENKISQLRKKRAILGKNFLFEGNPYEKPVKMMLLSHINSKNVGKITGDSDSKKAFFSPFYEIFKETEVQELISYLEEYAKENNPEKNFYDFIQDKKFLIQLKINKEFAASFNNFYANELYESTFWKDAVQRNDTMIQALVLDWNIRKTQIKVYNLEYSTWKPLDGIDKLIEELKNKGPLVVLGNLGQHVYKDMPFKAERVEYRDIYGWRKNAERMINPLIHPVVLVGAKKTQDIAHVYFIDPSDRSNPEDRSEQIIYKTSFANLASNIENDVADFDVILKVNYAIHGKFQI